MRRYQPSYQYSRAQAIEETIVTVAQFKFGVVNAVSARSIVRGAAASSLNWLTKGDKIELRRGQAYIGVSSLVTGNGKTSGIKKTTRADGTEQLWGATGKKLKYLDNTTLEWVENGTDLLGSNVVDSDGFSSEPITMQEYVTPAGNQLWVNSPNIADIFKIMIANPGSSTAQYDSSKNFKGNIKIDSNRTILWRTIKDQTGVYGSYVDNQTYTTVTSEALAASATGTLAFKGGGAKRTCFGVVFTKTGVTYTDNYNGVLVASTGSNGTINYTTGAWTTPGNANSGTADYQWEDATNHGIADFTKSSPRVAGEGFIFRQDEGGGAIQNIGTYAAIYFCFHVKKTWALTIQATDTSATNLPYRQNVGIPAVQAMVEAGEGIYYIDASNPDDVKVRLLTYTNGGSQQIIPIPVSNNLNINDYSFDQACGQSWGDLVLFSCRTLNSTVNNRVLVYNRLWKSWDILDYNVNCFDIFNGALVVGDSISNNFLTLFSGFDDLEGVIDNYWIGNIDSMSIDGLKKVKKFYIEGEISVSQTLDVFISLDEGPFVLLGSISGTGSYVDTGQSIDIGSQTIGTHTIGGDSVGNISHFERQFAINTDKFETAQLKYVAREIGYVSVLQHKYWDVRYKGKKVPVKYRG